MRFFIFLLLMGFAISSHAQDNEAELDDTVTIQILNTKTFLDDTSIFKKGMMQRISRTVHTSAPAPTHSHIELNLSYQSDDIYNGRKNSTVIPLITPRVSYIFKNGLQFDASVGYDVHNPSPQTNQYIFDGVYNYSPGNGNYSASVTASTFIYNKQSRNTTAEQRGSIEIDNSYDFNFVQPSLYLTWCFGGGKDYAATFSLQHEFDMLKNKLSITPTFNVNAGTQNFLDSYYKNRKYKIHQKKEPPEFEEVIVYGDVLNAGKFIILDYEMAVPISYSFKRFTFNITPNYSIPVHAAETVIATSYHEQILKTTYKKEDISNTFFYQASVTYDF